GVPPGRARAATGGSAASGSAPVPGSRDSFPVGLGLAGSGGRAGATWRVKLLSRCRAAARLPGILPSLSGSSLIRTHVRVKGGCCTAWAGQRVKKHTRRPAVNGRRVAVPVWDGVLTVRQAAGVPTRGRPEAHGEGGDHPAAGRHLTAADVAHIHREAAPLPGW